MQENPQVTGNASAPFSDGIDMLASLCRALDERLMTLLDAFPAGRQRLEDFSFRGLVITDAEVRSLLSGTPGMGTAV